MSREYPSKPIIGVGVLIKHGEEYLLIKRAFDPDKGLWTIPGGTVKVGEEIREAALREVQEETGLEVEIGELLDVIDKIVYDEAGRIRYHFVIVDFFAIPKEGIMRASSDVLEARWVRREEFRRYPLTETFRLLLKNICLWNEEP